jgi:hypothetical protein
MANEVTSRANICDDPDPAKKAVINFYKSKGRCAEADELEWWANNYRNNTEQTLEALEFQYNHERLWAGDNEQGGAYLRNFCNVAAEVHRGFYKLVDGTTSPKCVRRWP